MLGSLSKNYLSDAVTYKFYNSSTVAGMMVQVKKNKNTKHSFFINSWTWILTSEMFGVIETKIKQNCFVVYENWYC
jgi:hypothetical protein